MNNKRAKTPSDTVTSDYRSPHLRVRPFIEFKNAEIIKYKCDWYLEV